MNYRCLITQLAIILGIVIMPGCTNFRAATGEIIGNRQEYTVAPELHNSPPMIVAILPFKGSADTAEACEMVRENFYSSFSILHYTDVELSAIDAALKKDGIDPADIETADPARLGNILGADALIYGEVTQYSRRFLLAYANVTVGLSAKMIRVRDGRMLWSARKTFRSHAGGPAISPEGLLLSAFWAGLKMRNVEYIRTVGNATREIVQSIPNPNIQWSASREPPALKSAAAGPVAMSAGTAMAQDTGVAQTAMETPGFHPAAALSSAWMIADASGRLAPDANTAVTTAASSVDKELPADVRNADCRIYPAELAARDSACTRGASIAQEPNRQLEYLRNVIKQHPDDHRTHCSIGFIYYQEGDIARAIEAIKSASRIEPSHAGYHYNLGLAYMESGMMGAAQEHLRMIPAGNPLWSNAQKVLNYAHTQALKEL